MSPARVRFVRLIGGFANNAAMLVIARTTTSRLLSIKANRSTDNPSRFNFRFVIFYMNMC
jgi:hypothetical protein